MPIELSSLASASSHACKPLCDIAKKGNNHKESYHDDKKMIRNYLILSIAFVGILLVFSSCKKCNTEYSNPNSSLSFLYLDVELHEYESSNTLMVVVNYKDQNFKHNYLDSIEITPIHGKRLFTLERVDNNIYLFDTSKDNMEALDIKIKLYAPKYFKKSDSTFIYKNLKKHIDCYYSTAFH